MKRRTKLFRLAVLVLVLILSIFPLTSCGEGITEAKSTVEDFCAALEAGDTATALTKMHPSVEMTEDELTASILSIENTLGISFADGVTVVLCKDTSIQYSINFPKGLIGEITLEFDIIVSGKFLNLSVEVLEYDGAVGIYTFLLKEPAGSDNGNNEGNSNGVNSI